MTKANKTEVLKLLFGGKIYGSARNFRYEMLVKATFVLAYR
jgi:hypothetical protein